MLDLLSLRNVAKIKTISIRFVIKRCHFALTATAEGQSPGFFFAKDGEDSRRGYFHAFPLEEN